MEKLKISVKLHCEPKPVFTALLNAAQHSKITESECLIQPSEKSKFSILNGTVQGSITELFPYKRMLVSWRHNEYDPSDKDSIVEFLFIYKDEHTLLTITHSQIPDEWSAKIKEIWKKKYFKNLKLTFNKP